MRLLIDLSNIAYRVAHVLKLSHRGQKTHIIYGVLKSLESLALELEPEEIVICWDAGSARRKEIFFEYKANRKKDLDFLEDLHRQLALLREFFNCLPVIQCEIGGAEADDVIAVLAKFLHLEEVGIVTTDSDLFQLCQAPKHSIISPKTHCAIKLDMKPEQYLIYRLLVGNKDNVPGVTQIGDKKARNLITQFGTLKRILKHSKAKNGLGKLDHKQVKDVVTRNLKLWDLSTPHLTDAEKKCVLDQYRHGRLNRSLDADKLHDMCMFFGLSSFIRRFSMFSGAFKQMIRGGNGKENSKRSGMDQKIKNGARYAKRFRTMESGSDASEGTKRGRGKRGRARRDGDAKVLGSKLGLQTTCNQQKRTKDGYVCRIRKIEALSSLVSGRHKSSKAAIRTDKPRPNKGTVDGRSRRIDFSDPGLSPSKRVKGAREGRRASALLILSMFARGKGEEWIKKQSTERLKFVSGLIAKIESEETSYISKSELAKLQELDEEYTSIEPDWMKSIYAE